MNIWPSSLVFIALICVGSQAIGQEAQESSATPSFDCLIEPRSVIELTNAIDGVVEEVLVDRGAKVKKGQLLARLESSIERANYEMAKVKAQNDASLALKQTRLGFAQRRLARNASLIKSGVLTKKEADEIKTAREAAKWELEEAKWQKKLTQIELQRAEAQLKLREIRSPVDGYVLERNLEPGETTSQNYILKLAELDPLHVKVFVPVHLLEKVALGETVDVSLDKPMETKFQGEVSVIDRVADAASGMMQVRVAIKNVKYDKLAGLKCHATFPSIKSHSAEASQSARPGGVSQPGEHPQ